MTAPCANIISEKVTPTPTLKTKKNQPQVLDILFVKTFLLLLKFNSCSPAHVRYVIHIHSKTKQCFKSLFFWYNFKLGKCRVIWVDVSV